MKFIRCRPEGAHYPYQDIVINIEHIVTIKHSPTNGFGTKFAEITLINDKSLIVQADFEELIQNIE